MKKRVVALICFALFWLVYFLFSRLLFILSQYHNSFTFRVDEILATFWHGAALDISTTGYYLLIPVLLAIPSVLFTGSWYKHLVRWYSCLLIIVSSVIIVSDANLYSYWGYRMDYTPVLYLKTPAEAMASVSTLKIILNLAAIILISGLFIYLYNRFINVLFDDFRKVRYPLPAILFFMLLCGSLIIPIRGGFGVAPINAGSVYFSRKMFLNHTAVNAVWNVGTSAFTNKPVKNPYEFGDLSEAKERVSALTARKGIPTKVLNNDNPDILIFVLESFSNFFVGPLGGDSLVTPNLNRYVKEGILFSNFYASGPRTDKALPAILDGYPAQPAQSIIKEPKKSQTLSSLVKIFNDKGYNSSFWYGGEINFANFNSFIIGSGFEKIITKDNFDKSSYNSKWGVHDHILLKALADSMRSVREPFFRVVLTLSSHEPFDVPMDPVFSGSDNYTKYKNSVYYTDRYLGKFLDWAKGTEWWKNTLVIMVADHCCRYSADIPVYSMDIFKIPMLWLGGAVAQKDLKVDRPGSQVDIPVTLLSQLNTEGIFPFGKDLLSEGSEKFAFYTYNEGFAFITGSSAVIYDHKLRKPVLREGKDPDAAEKDGKAFLQVLFDDYLKR
jgi:phosphoglycerol transferase MdoB-like AlkP superfamily enzyme